MWIGGLASEATTGYSLNVTPDGLVLLPLHYVSQYFEQVTWEGELVTFALLMDGILYTVSWKWNKDAEYELIANFKGLLIRYSGKYKYIQLLSTAASNLILQAAKAEKGSIFTGWPVWNYALELAKCQRYQYYKSGLWKFIGIGISPGLVNGKYELTAFISLPVTMRTNPAAAFENLYVTGGVGTYKTHKATRIRIVQDYIGGVELALQTDEALETGVPYYLAIKDTNGYFYLNANL